MKITNTEYNQSYQLSPDTQLDIERPNLFFNEWGEQTFPVEIPDTPANRQLTGYTDMLGNLAKPAANINCTIQDDSYFMSCRQAILSAQRKKGISTSFYINEGSFLSRLSDTRLFDVFTDEIIPDVTTVQQGINFCRTLLKNTNPHFAIFPILLDLDGERKLVNKVNTYDENGNYSKSGTIDFYNSFQRSETVNDTTIALSPGYYITPFIRASYLLRRVFSYFGYELQTGFFDVTPPFTDMVFINNTIDSIVNGTILLSHLIPDCMCSTLLNVYRKKFCCEFIPDEVARTVTIEFFRDIIKNKPSADLSDIVTSEPSIEFPEYKQLKLISENNVSVYDQYDSTAEISSKFPEAFLDKYTGKYVRIGYSESSVVTQIIADSTQPYYVGGNLPVYNVEVPDCTFSMTPAYELSQDGDRYGIQLIPLDQAMPYIGEGRTLNSTLILSSSATEDSPDAPEKDVKSEKEDQPPIFAFTYFDEKITYGTNHTANDRWQYSLLYNGEFGIYEQFYRDMDNLLRNSLYPVKVDLLLNPAQKMGVKSHWKILIRGQELLINKLAYKIGGKNEPTESEFLTTLLHTPLLLARPESERFLQNKVYKWRIQSTYVDISQEEYNANPIRVEGFGGNPLPAIYPKPPTKKIYDKGGSYFNRSYARHYVGRDGKDHYVKTDWALTPILFSESSIPDDRG